MFPSGSAKYIPALKALSSIDSDDTLHKLCIELTEWFQTYKRNAVAFNSNEMRRLFDLGTFGSPPQSLSVNEVSTGGGAVSATEGGGAVHPDTNKPKSRYRESISRFISGFKKVSMNDKFTYCYNFFYLFILF